MNKQNTIIAGVSAVVGFVAGGALTYVTVNKALRTRYEDWANEQIDSVKARYALMNEEGKRDFLAQAQNPNQAVLDAVAAGQRLVEALGYATEEESEQVELPHPSQRTLSIFDAATPEDEDGNPVDALADYRKIPGQPYLITEAEYFENEEGYELDTLTYYELDDTLTDEKNERIDRVEETVGARHLHMFQKNGTEKSSLYVRNDDHQSLYEIICLDQSYAVLILGMDEVELGLKEPKKKLKKMRDGD